MSKYPEDKLFGEWSPEQQREFKIDTLVDGKRWDAKWATTNEWITKVGASPPSYHPDVYYRLAPEPEIPDSIDWSHVHPDWIKLTRRAHENALLSAGLGYYCKVEGLASYKRGNMKECTVYRPGFEPEGEE